VKAAKKTVAPPKPQPTPPGSMPGSSQDHARHGPYGPAPSSGTFGFGGPSTGTAEQQRKREEDNRKRWKAQYGPSPSKPQRFFIGDDEDAAGVSIQTTVPKHGERLTKYGPKPVLARKKEDKLPQVPETNMTYPRGTKRKDVPPAAKPSILRKRPAEAGPPTKKSRRVSAHQV